MKNLRIITIFVLSILIIRCNLYAIYDNGTIITSSTAVGTPPNTISKNYIIEDFDGDFYKDIILMESITTTSVNLNWYKNDGNGNFTKQPLFIDVDNVAHDSEIFYKDMNQDGKNDIVFQNSNTGFTILFSDGQGNISTQLNNNITLENFVEVDLKEIADIDGDGDMDAIFFAKIDQMLWGNYWGLYFGYCIIGYNDGSGNLSNYNYLENEEEVFVMVETGDIDGDGDVDIICSGNTEIMMNGGEGAPSYENPFVRFYENLGVNGIANKVELDLPLANNAEADLMHIKLQDINGNGTDELLIEYAFKEQCLSELHLYNCVYDYQFHVLNYNTQNSEFVILEQYYFWLHGYTLPLNFNNYNDLYTGAFTIQFGFFDADINLDILSVNVPLGILQWYAGDGNGNFDNTQIVKFNNQFGSVRPALRVADIDNDTDLDVFVLMNDDTSSTLTVYKNLDLTQSCAPVSDLASTYLTTGVYQAGITLISSGNVVNGSNVTLKAGNNVKLQSGFRMPQNGSLKVAVDSCN